MFCFLKTWLIMVSLAMAFTGGAENRPVVTRQEQGPGASALRSSLRHLQANDGKERDEDEDEVVCDAVCLNGGECVLDKRERSGCSCPDFFIGNNCGVESCCHPSNNPCLNGGVCIETAGGDEGHCECPAGDNCETDSFCSPWLNPCVNGGVCIESDDGYDGHCECPVLFTGDDCATEFLVLSNESFESGDSGGICVATASTAKVEVTSDKGGYDGTSYAVRMRKESFMYTKAIDILGDTEFVISFAYMPRGMNVGDSFSLMFHIQEMMEAGEDAGCGSGEAIDTWVAYQTWTRGAEWTDNGTWYHHTATFKLADVLADFGLEGLNPKWLRVGFQNYGMGYYDKVFFDEIYIMGASP